MAKNTNRGGSGYSCQSRSRTIQRLPAISADPIVRSPKRPINGSRSSAFISSDVGIATLLVVLGLRATGDIPLDVFPEFAPPMVEIQTEAPALSTEEVESLITVPIETAVNGVPDRTTLRSKSVLGLSTVSILFDRGTDVIRARQLVQERVTQVQARLPAAARPPVMLPHCLRTVGR